MSEVDKELENIDRKGLGTGDENLAEVIETF